MKRRLPSRAPLRLPLPPPSQPTPWEPHGCSIGRDCWKCSFGDAELTTHIQPLELALGRVAAVEVLTADDEFFELGRYVFDLDGCVVTVIRVADTGRDITVIGWNDSGLIEHLLDLLSSEYPAS